MSRRSRSLRLRTTVAAKVALAVKAIDELVLSARITGENTLDARRALGARNALGDYLAWAETRSRETVETYLESNEYANARRSPAADPGEDGGADGTPGAGEG